MPTFTHVCISFFDIPTFTHMCSIFFDITTFTHVYLLRQVTDEMMDVSYYQAGSNSDRLYSYTMKPRDVKQLRERKSV